jgi:hypothetical protein
MRVRFVAMGVAVLAAAAVAAVSSDSQAGASWNATNGCAQFGTAGGSCWGTGTWFRNSSDPNAFETFTINNAASNGSTYFSAQLNGHYYSCSSNAPWAYQVWPAIIASAPKGYFYVSWDANGNCTSATVDYGSEF